MPLVYLSQKQYERVSKLAVLLRLKENVYYSRGKAIEWLLDTCDEKIKQIEEEVLSSA